MKYQVPLFPVNTNITQHIVNIANILQQTPEMFTEHQYSPLDSNINNNKSLNS